MTPAGRAATRETSVQAGTPTGWARATNWASIIRTPTWVPAGSTTTTAPPPPALTGASEDMRVCWAADGFEIHDLGDRGRSGYMLLPGARDAAPGCVHDGTYYDDWPYVQRAGNLDTCNGGMVDGQYVYVATESYPFFPRGL